MSICKIFYLILRHYRLQDSGCTPCKDPCKQPNCKKDSFSKGLTTNPFSYIGQHLSFKAFFGNVSFKGQSRSSAENLILALAEFGSKLASSPVGMTMKLIRSHKLDFVHPVGSNVPSTRVDTSLGLGSTTRPELCQLG